MKAQQELKKKGFTVIDNIYTQDEVQKIIDAIENADTSRPTFRKSADLFAIRQFLKGITRRSPSCF